MATTAEPGTARIRRRALRLEEFTIAWNAIECVSAVIAGVVAGSIALTGFGIDSAIETASALVVLHHLRAELGGRAVDESREQRALRFIAATFFALAAYVGVDAVIALSRAAHPRTSLVGIVVTSLSLVVMPVLARAKTHRSGSWEPSVDRRLARNGSMCAAIGEHARRARGLRCVRMVVG